MTGHLGLDDLAYLVGTDLLPSAEDHLAGCDICRNRLSTLRARSAEVSSALSGIGADSGAFAAADAEPMPDDVTLRITVALAAERAALGDGRGAPTHGRDVADAAQPDEPEPADGTQTDDGTQTEELAGARARRSRRLRGWLSAAAVVVVVGGGFGAITHFVSGRSADTNTASSAASDASAGESLSAQASAPAKATATADPGAARGVLRTRTFLDDAKAFVAAQSLAISPAPANQPLAGSGSSRCATVARGEASSTAGYKAGGGNAAPAAFVGAITVDGHPGVLYLVDVGPVKVAVAVAGCTTSSPDVLASATL